MQRLKSLLVLFLVLSMGSGFTFACAFLCGEARAAQAIASPSSAHAGHCHSAKPTPFPEGDGFRPAHALCPVLESLQKEEARTLQLVAKTPVSGIALLPFETSLLSGAILVAERGARLWPAPAPIPSPPFLRNLVLRL